MWKTNSDGATSYFVDGKLIASYYNGPKNETWACLYGDYPNIYLKRVLVSRAFNEAYVKKLILGWIESTP
jgi:hypothetical protein